MFDTSCKRRVAWIALLTCAVYMFFACSDHFFSNILTDSVTTDDAAREPRDDMVVNDQPPEGPQYSEDTVNWLSMRKGLLSSGSPKKVLFFTYMRGGSSFGGEFFNQDNETTYWYEPLSAYYAVYHGLSVVSLPQRILYSVDRQRRTQFPAEEQGRLVQYIDDVMTCQYDRLPPVAWLHPFITFSSSHVMHALRTCISSEALPLVNLLEEQCGALPYDCFFMETSLNNRCFSVLGETRRLMAENVTEVETLVDKVSEFVNTNEGIPDTMTFNVPRIVEFERCVAELGEMCKPCMKDAKELCFKSKVQAARVSRINMEEVDKLLAAIPDLSVIHFVRDPRGIVASRAGKEGLLIDRVNESKLVEVELLCRSIQDDLRMRHELEARYPGAFLQVRYEDLVTAPLDTAQTVYDFIGREVSGDWLSFAGLAGEGSQENERFGHARASVDRWKLTFPEGELDIIRHYCANVFNELGY